MIDKTSKLLTVPLKHLPQHVILTIAILPVYYILQRLIFRSTTLDEAAYHQSFLFTQTGSSIYSWIVLSIMGALLIFSRLYKIKTKWQNNYDIPFIRFFVGLISILLAWKYSTYDLNLYYDQAHYIDRVLLITSAILVIWKPIFVFPFLLILLPIIRQFNYPIGGYSVTESSLLYKLLILFASSLVIRIVFKRNISQVFLICACAMIAAFYFISGYKKLQIEWFSLAQPHLLLFSSYANGWLNFLDIETVSSLGRKLQHGTLFIKIYTLILECGVILLLWNRRTFILCITTCICFHLGILAISGIFFGMWISIGLALFGFAFTSGGKAFFKQLNKSHFITSLVVAIIGLLLFHPGALSWYDSSLSYTYEFEAIGESNNRYSLNNSTVTPYDYQFTLSGFTYLSKDPVLPTVWGSTTNKPFATTLSKVQTIEDLEQVTSTHAHVSYNEEASLKFDAFMIKWISRYQEVGTKSVVPTALRFPLHLWRFPKEPSFENQEKIKQVDIFRVTTFFDKNSYSVLDRTPVRSIPFPIQEDSDSK